MIADVPFDHVIVGNKASLSKTITETDVYSFAGICMDFNPIHVNKVFASNTRFKNRVAHGMISASLISAVIGTCLPGKNTIYLEQTLKFTAPVFIGDTIEAQVEVIEIIKSKNILKLKTEVLNQNNEIVITGKAIVMKE